MKKHFLYSLFAILSLIIVTNVYATTESNDIDSESVVNSITLTKITENKIKWSVDGYSKNGYKVVWSKNNNPEYPLRDGDKYHYYSNPGTLSDEINEAFSGAGTYYVRVCEYLGGACGVYSNEVTLSLGENSSTKKETNKVVSNDNTTLDSKYEKIPNIESIKYFEKIKKVGEYDLYGIRITLKIPEGKEWIKSLADVKYFDKIEKVGDNLYGVRISDAKKKAIQKKIDVLNEQLKKIQDQITSLMNELNSIQ